MTFLVLFNGLSTPSYEILAKESFQVLPYIGYPYLYFRRIPRSTKKQYVEPLMFTPKKKNKIIIINYMSGISLFCIKKVTFKDVYSEESASALNKNPPRVCDCRAY